MALADTLKSYTREYEKQQGFLEVLTEDAYKNAESQLRVAANSGKRECDVRLVFTGSVGGNSHYFPVVHAKLVQILRVEKLNVREPLSYNDKTIRVSWQES